MYVRLSLPTPQVDEYKVCSSAPLGPLLLVRLEKQRYWVEDNWFCRYVTVAPPGGGTALTFPCYRWLIGNVKVELREGTGKWKRKRLPFKIRISSFVIKVRFWGEKADPRSVS